MSRRQGPGRHIGSGHIRVDAARAVAKLRDYQLADPHHWVLEIVRGAVAIGAPRVFAEADADDVWISWQGKAPTGDELERLLDELISPTPSKDRAYLRLLAIGVNTALGVAPRFVDLYASDGEQCGRVRYTPGLLEAPTGAGEASALAGLEATAAAAPPRLPQPGFLLHLKRWPGWDTLKRFVDGREAPELRAIRARCRDMPVPLEVGRSELGRHRSSSDLLRVELGFGLDGFVALLDPSAMAPETSQAWMDVAEQGVVIARHVLPFLPGGNYRPMPLRLFVDAARMPTNASRSDVRAGESPVREAMARAKELVPELAKRLVQELSDKATHNWNEVQREALRRATIQLVAAPIAGPLWHVDLASDVYPKALAPLLELPLVRNAMGGLVSLRSLMPLDSHVHRMARPVPAELEAYFRHTLWAPSGSPEASLFAGHEPENTSGSLARAQVSQRHRAAFYATKPGPALVPKGRDQLLCLPLVAPTLRASCVPARVFAVPNLGGEVCLLDPRFARLGEVRWLLDGREIARTQFDGPMPFIAVVTAEGLVANPDYKGLVQNARFREVLDAVLGAVVRGAEAIARIANGKATPEGFHLLSELDLRTSGVPELLAHVGRLGLRRAVDLSTRAALERDGASLGAAQLALSHSPLVTSPLFPCYDGTQGEGPPERRLTSFTRLRARVARTAESIVVTRGGKTAPRGHLVLELDSNDRSLLQALLGPEARLIPYTLSRASAALPSGRELARRIVVAGGVALGMQGEGHTCAIAWGGRTTQELHYHRGALLEQSLEVPTRVGCTLAVDDLATVPTVDWRGVALRGPSRELAYLEDALCQAVVDTISGLYVPDVVMSPGQLVVSGAVRRSLLLSVGGAAGGAKKMLGRKRYRRFRELPLVPTLGHAMLSLKQIDERWQESIPYLDRDVLVDFDAGDFTPLHIDETMASAVGRLLGRVVLDAKPKLEEYRRAAQRLANRRGHDAQPAAPLWLPGPLSGERVEGALGNGWVTLRAPIDPRGLTIRAFIDGRPFDVVVDPEGLPLSLVIDVPEHLANDSFDELSRSAIAKLKSVAARGARRLLRELLTSEPATLGDDLGALELLTSYVERADSKTALRTVDDLRSAAIFTAVDGTRRSITDALIRKRVRIADFSGELLGPQEGEAKDLLDAPILRVPHHEAGDAVRGAIAALSGSEPQDCTGALRQLQARRRVERGLVPKPRIDGANPTLTFNVLDLLDPRGAAARLLGPGEVTLKGSTGATRVEVFALGALVGAELVRGNPALHVAVEAPGLAASLAAKKTKRRLKNAIDELSDAVCRKLLAAPDELPQWARSTLRRAVVTGEVGDIEMIERGGFFMTTAGDAVGLEVLRAQAARFDSVWTTSVLNSSLEPLDPKRLAFQLTEDESIELLAHLPVVDAREDLGFDAIARRQIAKAPLARLEFTDKQLRETLATVELPGDGVKSARGFVAPLRPGAFALAGVYVHRGMKLLGRQADVCGWPTVTLVDDAGLEPNRTHEGAVADERWERLVGRVRSASERALRGTLVAPKACLISQRISRRERKPDGTSLRGILWLESSPLGVGNMQMLDRRGAKEQSLAATPLRPVSGRLLLHGHAKAVSPADIEAFIADGYRKMVGALKRTLLLGEAPNRGSALAHLLTALSAGHARLDGGSGSLTVDHFRDRERSLSDVATLIDERTAVLVVSDDDDRVHPGPVVVDDGTLTAHALIAALPGAFRATRPGQHVASKRSTSTPEAAATHRRPPKPPKAHALDPLAAELQRRVQLAGIELLHVSIAPRTASPMMSYAPHFKALKLAGKHAQLVAAGAAALSSDPRSEAALSLLTAHAVGVVGRGGAVTGATDDGMVRSLLSAPKP